MRGENTGTRYSLAQRFGSAPVAPLLRCLVQELPDGSRLHAVTLIDSRLRDLMKLRGRAVGRFLPWRYDAEIRVRATGDMAELVAMAERQEWRRFAVQFRVYDHAGHLLVEAEDGKNDLWLAAALPAAAHEKIVAAAGGAVSRLDRVRSRCQT